MGLIPVDYPDLLAARGVPVTIVGGWETRGSSADHRAVVLHHTASSENGSPYDEAQYCAVGADIAPLYNVLIDRYGAAWILAREKANSSGEISGVALDEALNGHADLTPAAARGLPDTTSNNGALFAISAQNNGVGEHWSTALIEGMAIAAAVALECLGLTPGHVTTHRALTSRKIDPCGDECPSDWAGLVNAQLGGQDTPGYDDGGYNRGGYGSETMLIEQPGRTVDATRRAVAELRPDTQQICLWNGASMAYDVPVFPGDADRRGELRVLNLGGYTGGMRIMGWKPWEGDAAHGVVVMCDGGGATFHFGWT